MDFSFKSRQIAQLRAKFRNLSNVIWISDWIESLPLLGIGSFDLTICLGVIHHIKNPEKGTSILRDSQRISGGANLMVYGKYGRAGIYHMQELMKKVNMGVSIIHEELKNAKIVIYSLPDHHWFNSNYYRDHKTMGDVGVYDLILHKRDISYDIKGLYTLIEQGCYNYVNYDNILGMDTMIWRPNKLSRTSVKVLSRSSNLNQMLSGEIISSKMVTHSIYMKNSN